MLVTLENTLPASAFLTAQINVQTLNNMDYIPDVDLRMISSEFSTTFS